MWIDISPSEAFAQACGILQTVLAALLWRHHWLRRGWGLGWLALSMGVAAAVNLAAPWAVTPLLKSGSLLNVSPVLAGTVMALGFASLASLVAGLRSFCQRPGWGAARVFFTLWVVAPTMVIGLALLHMPLAGDSIKLILFTYVARLRWQTGSREPGVVHHLLATVLLLYPVMVIAMGLTQLEITTVRYLAAAPYTVIGIVLLSVTLNRLRMERERGQGELRELNTSLEQRVAQRTQEIAQRNTELAQSLEALERTRCDLQSTGGGPVNTAAVFVSIADRRGRHPDHAQPHPKASARERAARSTGRPGAGQLPRCDGASVDQPRAKRIGARLRSARSFVYPYTRAERSISGYRCSCPLPSRKQTVKT